ncbi:hypothetical protein CGRA01v4_14737 [Colletotrichum graminicola]|nr:hypothetical protein CGRA01v4_14737 [Colletotrichum graminicola]
MSLRLKCTRWLGMKWFAKDVAPQWRFGTPTNFRGADTDIPHEVEPVIVVLISKTFADKTVPVLIPYQEGTSQFLNGDSTAGKQAQGHEAVRVCSGTRNGGWLASLGINASRQKCGPIHFSPKDA